MSKSRMDRQARTSRDAADHFERPADCPRCSCAALVDGKRELELLRRAQSDLRAAAAREHLLVARQQDLIARLELSERESSHRLLNGLQMVSSLLLLQAGRSRDEEITSELEVAAQRVATIGGLHRRLRASDAAEVVDLAHYLEAVCADMSELVGPEKFVHGILFAGIALNVAREVAVSLGLIVAELVTNALKYARGDIEVRLESAGASNYVLSVSDDGPGLSEGFDPDLQRRGLGMGIVRSLAKDIGGCFFAGRAASGGAKFTVMFAVAP